MNNHTPEQLAAIRYFKRSKANTPHRPDGSIDYEMICGEALAEGEKPEKVKAMWDQLPNELKQP